MPVAAMEQPKCGQFAVNEKVKPQWLALLNAGPQRQGGGQVIDAQREGMLGELFKKEVY